MKERPILFSGPMVRAILDGTKTQTRRILKINGITPVFIGYPGEESDPAMWEFVGLGLVPDADEPLTVEWFVDNRHSQYGRAGDRLWVREAWAYNWGDGDCPVTASGEVSPWPHADAEVFYRADGEGQHEGVWKPSIHMRRSASRITLAIRSVRIQRLHEITEEGARAEGIVRLSGYGPKGDTEAWGIEGMIAAVTARRAYEYLWEEINGTRSWDLNPWVAAIEFRRIEQ